MGDRLAGLFLKLALLALDKWLDARIKRAGWDAPTKERIQLLEDEMVQLLDEFARSESGKKIVRAFAKLAIDAKFPNDPSTATWG